MRTITLQDIKKSGAQAISNDEVSYLFVNSKPKSAILPFDIYNTFVEAMEELEDLKSILQRQKEDDIDAKDVFDSILGDDKE